MSDTKIPWAQKVWNPTTGCTKVSQGCKNCYAERIANRFWKDRKFSEVLCHPERLDDPLRWKKPQRIFVDSMSDLFHPDVPTPFLDEVSYVMSQCDHTFIILTKRPSRMLEYMQRTDPYLFARPDLWMGVSVEDQATADERIPMLLQTPAAVRFVSYEPALGEIDIYDHLGSQYDYRPTYPFYPPSIKGDGKPILLSPGIDWLIMGSESGPGARPMDIEWARSVKNQCVNAGVPFFFKQQMVNGKLVHMPELDGHIFNQFPEFK